MLAYILKRLAFGLLTLWAVTLMIFLATHALPGDPARAILGQQATPGQLAALRRQLHTDRPLLDQYVTWLGETASLRLGNSLSNGLPVVSYLTPRIYASIVLMLCTAAISTPVGILLGAWSAWRRDDPVDHVVALITLLLAALPEFVIGIALVILFATSWLHILPAVYLDAQVSLTWADLEQLILPTATLALAVIPYIARLMRGVMVEVLESEYIAHAQLKGLRNRIVLFRHAVPNALGPVVQVIALQIGYLLGGVVVVEWIFNYPGVGSAFVDAVSNRDLPLIQALALVIAGSYVVVNLLADVLIQLAQPWTRDRAGRR